MTMLPEIKWYENLDSTNNELRRHLDTLDNMSVIAARNQTAGRGQGDHVWTSPAGENLTFSLLAVHEPGLLAKDSDLINLVAGAAMREFFDSYGISVWMKPPNDIWYGDRKICGMLIENILRGKEISKTIFGIGVNVNQTVFPDYLPNPVSMAQITGCRYNLDATLRQLLEVFVSHLRDLRP